jgi:perosamine synthetase
MNKWKVPLNKPFFSNETKELVMNVLNSGMVSQGEMVEQFEEEVRKYVGAKYALAVSSCTAGMWMVLNTFDQRAVWWTVPAFTFPAIHNIKEMYGSDVQLNQIDVSNETYNIKTKEIESGMFTETIVPVHQFGMPCDMDEIQRIARKNHGTFVLEDAACALGSKYKGKMIGSTGTAVFSFHGRKILTTGEGGMIVTDDEEIYERCLLMRQFVRSKTGQFEGHGLNFKLSDVAAAMGIGQMKWLDDTINMRNVIANEYDHRLWGQGIEPPYYDAGEEYQTNYQSYVINLEDEEKPRDAVLNSMRENEIEVQVGSYDQSNGSCVNSAQLAATTLALPIWPEMTLEDIDLVINALEEALT